MAFRDDFQRATTKVLTDSRIVFVSSATEFFNSIVFGSALTGSPGQPVADVDGGNLRASWQLTFPTPTSALVSTNSVYAPPNEDGIARPSGGPYLLRASIGGRFSVALSTWGLSKIVLEEARRLRAA